MEKRIFCIDFYPHEWVAETARLTLEERGLFIQVVSLIYCNRGPIANDAGWIGGVSGCSSRLANRIIHSLVDKGFLQVTSSGQITQKRAENELKTKRKWLEKGPKVSRKPLENEAQAPNNNDLSPRDQGAPRARVLLTSSLEKKETSSSFPVTASAKGEVLKKGNGEGRPYRVTDHLTDAGFEAARKQAGGWDIYHLGSVYDGKVNGCEFPVPTNPDKAFPAWCKSYTKGNPPA